VLVGVEREHVRGGVGEVGAEGELVACGWLAVAGAASYIAVAPYTMACAAVGAAGG